MARTVIITDDLTGEKGAKPRSFVLDGTAYELDLTDASFAELKKALRPYLKHARVTNGGRVGGKGSTTRKASAKGGAKRRPKAAANGTDSAAIRAWAVAHQVAVPKRGRIPASVVAAYQAAQGS